MLADNMSEQEIREAYPEKESYMPTITVEPELYQRVEQAAQERHASADEITTEAIRQFLWDLDRRKISAESDVYRQRHDEFKVKYLGKYIAIRNGQVIDYDVNFPTLRQRVRQQFGRLPVMITLVEEEPDRPLTRHGHIAETGTL